MGYNDLSVDLHITFPSIEYTTWQFDPLMTHSNPDLNVPIKVSSLEMSLQKEKRGFGSLMIFLDLKFLLNVYLSHSAQYSNWQNQQRNTLLEQIIPLVTDQYISSQKS